MSSYNLRQRTPPHITTVAVLGAESTGKTTLCQDLAAHYNEPWVGEYMRPYLQAKWDSQQATCTWDDLLPIAQGQIKQENEQAAKAQRYLFCDTNLVELMVYAQWYYHDCPAAIIAAAHQHQYDLILLTDTDVPWIADDLRDLPHQREQITACFAQALQQNQQPYQTINGDRQARVRQVVGWLDEIRKN